MDEISRFSKNETTLLPIFNMSTKILISTVLGPKII